MGPDAASRYVLLGGYGLALLLVGAALRLWPGLPDAGLEIAAGVTLLTALGVGATWLARPARLGALVFGASFLVAGWGLVVAALVVALPDRMQLEALPRGLELVGGALWLLATAGRQVAQLGRPGHRSRALGGKVRRAKEGGGWSSAGASALKPGDRVRLQPGATIPADGKVLVGAVTVDESSLFVPHEPRQAGVGERVYGGTLVIEGDAELEVVHGADASVARDRDRRLEELRMSELELIPSSTGAALLAVVLAASLAALGGWLTAQQADPNWQRLATTHVATLLAVFAGVPLVALLRGRKVALEAAVMRGLWFTRPGDVAAFFSARQWRLDPMLLASPGPVEVLAFGAVPGSELLRWAEALARPWRGPEAVSLAQALAEQDREPANAASVKDDGGLRFGTVDGQRIVLGSPESMESERGLRLDGDQQRAVRYLRDRPSQVWLIASDVDGLLGAIGVEITASPGAKACLDRLGARLLPGLDEAALSSVARASGARAKAKAPGRGDASLLAAETEAPHRGLRVRVVDHRTDVTLSEAAAPRILQAALHRFPETVELVAALRGAARTRAGLVTMGAAVATAAMVGASVLEPALAALVGRLGLFFAFTPYAREPGREAD